MATDPIKHHYGCLTPAERFALTIEAMARGDENEADKLEDSCPRHAYRMEDQEYRDRMRRAYIIALMVSLNMRQGIGQIRAAATFCELAPKHFGHGPEFLAKVAFLYGRSYGHWEAGKTEQVGLPERKELTSEIKENPDLRRQLAEVKGLVGTAMAEVAETLKLAVGEAHAVDLLSQWDGFGRFCREVLALEPLTLLKALRLATEDPAAEVLASFPDAKVDEAKAAEWAQTWRRNWDRRFGRFVAETK
jgi:hypothetical protein